ncbi:hypothetical protein HPP92_022458 [Vanilla planifolia]|uniref:GCF C-terminal domain-containing protein n=1 Tax=Vanilla planifolia TaxID=51239 RepID=A0A835PVF2_VANPL|nr:hypothetical protein HPP92_022458 [Vanilla planifolia]
MSSDGSDSESSAYSSTLKELLQTAKEVFSDAADEYSKLSVVKDRFERWKKEYLPSYRDAYIPLSAPSIFSPYVRLELLEWDPLYKTTDFFDMEWHKILLDYGSSGGEINFEPDDADANLIPELVEKECNLGLLEVVHRRVAEAIANLGIPGMGYNSHESCSRCYTARSISLWNLNRLMRNICLWKDILALPVLEKLALQELLIGKLLPHIRSIMPSLHDAITKLERIIASLDGVWYGPKVTADHRQKLQPLVECVAEIGKKLERRHASGVNIEETIGLARRLKTILVQLNECDRARMMLKGGMDTFVRRAWILVEGREEREMLGGREGKLGVGFGGWRMLIIAWRIILEKYDNLDTLKLQNNNLLKDVMKKCAPSCK